jgi:dethiobiotin synthetase
MGIVQGLFITGTDTGVGKSLLACAIIRHLREKTVDAVGFKPVATGEIQGIPGDAAALYEASGRVEPLEAICPCRYALPMAPTLAARGEGLVPDMDLARKALVHLCSRHSTVIIEGLGGLLAPLDRRTLLIDFAAETGFPILVVCRAAVGTINHTLLTLRELERAKLPLAGIVMNTANAFDAAASAGSREEIERISGRKMLAVLPYLGAKSAPEALSGNGWIGRAMAELAAQVNVLKLLGSGKLTARKRPRAPLVKELSGE